MTVNESVHVDPLFGFVSVSVRERECAISRGTRSVLTQFYIQVIKINNTIRNTHTQTHTHTHTHTHTVTHAQYSTRTVFAAHIQVHYRYRYFPLCSISFPTAAQYSL